MGAPVFLACLSMAAFLKSTYPRYRKKIKAGMTPAGHFIAIARNSFLLSFHAGLWEPDFSKHEIIIISLSDNAFFLNYNHQDLPRKAEPQNLPGAAWPDSPKVGYPRFD
jgi:hypothetical protein